MALRVNINDFAQANRIYIGATVTFYTIDGSGVKTSTKATLYDAATGSGTLANPVTLDSEGKFFQPVYIETAVIATISGLTIADHDTGIIAVIGKWRGDWATATIYYAGEFVRAGAAADGTNDILQVQSTHTSATFATDVSGGKLSVILDVSTFNAIDATLQAIADLATAADRGVYFTGSDVAALFTLTAAGRALLAGATAAAQRATLGSTAVGDALFIAASESAAFTAIKQAASDTATGVVEKSTSAENVTGTSDTVYPTVAGVKEIVNTHAPETFVIACSDETTAITSGTAKVTFRMPHALTVTAVRASLSTASTAGAPQIDINEGGVSILSTAITIDANELTSTTAATPAVISDTALADDAAITIDIDSAGTGAKGLKVEIIGKKA